MATPAVNMAPAKQGGSGAVKAAEASGKMNLEQLQHMINCTVKKNPKTELSKSDLLRLLGYLEGELQARDVVIATLKTDRVKQLVSHARYGRLLPANDPYVALQRDGRSASMAAPFSDDAALLKAVNEGPMTALDALVAQHRKSHVKLIQAMQEAEARHSKVLRELDEERRKHEHDTAQGDDITYGLEKERTRLKEELELEVQARKKLEKEAKKVQETLDEERQRQKQIVLLLLAERKKLIVKYVDERKRSEDLAQILADEKLRVDSMADGLEEESRRVLQMEAELEKQVALFDAERAHLRAQLSRQEQRTKDLELAAEKLQAEVDNLKKQQAEAHQVAMFQAGLNQPQTTLSQGHSPPRLSVNRPQLPALGVAGGPAPAVGGGGASAGAVSPPQLPTKPTLAPPQTPPRASSVASAGATLARTGTSPSGVALASATGHVVLGTAGKVVAPTATVSSTPVPAPTTGIARAVSPAGGFRNIQYGLNAAAAAVGSRTQPPPAAASSSAAAAAASATSSSSSSGAVPVTSAAGAEATGADSNTVGREGPVPASTASSSSSSTSVSGARVAVSSLTGTKVFTTTNKEGKVTFHVTSSSSSLASKAPSPGSALSSAATTTTSTTAPTPAAGGQPTTPRKTTPAGLARGAPPPVPPNKPVIPPKKSSAASSASAVGVALNSTPSTAGASSPDESSAGSVLLHMGV